MLPGQSIRLLSHPLRGSRGAQCLQFYYHMYGSGTGTLNLHLKHDSGDTLLWQQSGEQSITWLKATVEFQCDSQHQARAETQKHSGISGTRLKTPVSWEMRISCYTTAFRSSSCWVQLDTNIN